jgi:hypothetical protein
VPQVSPSLRDLGTTTNAPNYQNIEYGGLAPTSLSNRGHPVTGNFVRRSPNAYPPCAYKCISTGTRSLLQCGVVRLRVLYAVDRVILRLP